MTILQDEHKSTTPKPDNDAVVELMARAMAEAQGPLRWNQVSSNVQELWRADAARVLCALSDAGLAVLPLEATREMDHAARLSGEVNFWFRYRTAVAAFQPSQLETKHD